MQSKNGIILQIEAMAFYCYRKTFVESCRKCPKRVTVNVYQRSPEVRQSDLACRKCKKCAEVRENPVQVRADFSKRAKKRYIMHT